MNCPLCETELTEENICPNCGWSAAAQEQEKAAAKAARYANLPGIYSLVPDEDEDEEKSAVRGRSRRHTGAGRYGDVEASGKAGNTGNTGKPGNGKYTGGPIARLRQAWSGADPKTRWNIRFAAGMVGGTLLLFLFIACFYAPNAAAVTGRSGISMNNREFYIYYRNAYSSFLSASKDSSGNVSVPFTTARRLDRQYYNLETGYSWQDYFMDQALQSAALTETLAAAARAEGFTMDEAAADSLAEQLAALENAAGGLEAVVQARYGGPVTAAVYADYLQDQALAQAYYERLYRETEVTEEQLQAHYDANRSDYTDLTISEMPDVNVRHILYHPEGDAQEDWDAAQAKAESALEACSASDNPLETFLRLAAESQDSGSSSAGGLLENVYAGAIGGSFDSWCFDPQGRSNGELAVVMSGYGWHLVYFESYCSSTHWKEVVEKGLREAAASERVSQLLQQAHCRLTMFAGVPREQ